MAFMGSKQAERHFLEIDLFVKFTLKKFYYISVNSAIMDNKTLKIELTRLILETENTDLLKRLFKDIKKEKADFWLELSEDQKAEVELSRQQVENGETESWDSIIKRIS